MSLDTTLFEPGRFAGCPPICKAANLPAFETEKEYSDFAEKNSPGQLTVKKWRCGICKKIHVYSIGPGPSGASSGSTRGAKRLAHYQDSPKDLAELLKATMLCEMRAMTDICRLPGKRPGQYKWPKLSEAYRHAYGKDFDGAHDALADVRATIAVHKWRLSQNPA